MSHVETSNEEINVDPSRESPQLFAFRVVGTNEDTGTTAAIVINATTKGHASDQARAAGIQVQSVEVVPSDLTSRIHLRQLRRWPVWHVAETFIRWTVTSHRKRTMATLLAFVALAVPFLVGGLIGLPYTGCVVGILLSAIGFVLATVALCRLEPKLWHSVAAMCFCFCTGITCLFLIGLGRAMQHQFDGLGDGIGKSMAEATSTDANDRGSATLSYWRKMNEAINRPLDESTPQASMASWQQLASELETIPAIGVDPELVAFDQKVVEAIGVGLWQKRMNTDPATAGSEFLRAAVSPEYGTQKFQNVQEARDFFQNYPSYRSRMAALLSSRYALQFK